MNIKHMQLFSAHFRTVVLCMAAALWFLTGTYTHAGVSVTPSIIDEKASARDIIDESVTLKNTTGRKLNLYAIVQNVASDSGEREFKDPSVADSTTSLANWILFPRSVIELSPGEEKRIDFTIEVFQRALHGVYHAEIVLVEGSTRDEAERAKGSAPRVSVNVDVLEDIKERLQISRFVPTRTFFSGFPVEFVYEIENIGNRDLTPIGEIRIYNRGGKEVGTISIGGIVEAGESFESTVSRASQESAVTIVPDTIASATGTWNGPIGGNGLLASVGQAFQGYGRYKAILDLEYGSQQRGTINDIVFFWVFPWKVIISIFVLLSVGIIVMMRYTYKEPKKDR